MQEPGEDFEDRPEEAAGGTGWAVAGIVFGVLALLVPPVCGPIGIILGIVGRVKGAGSFATAAIVLSVVTTVAGLAANVLLMSARHTPRVRLERNSASCRTASACARYGGARRPLPLARDVWGSPRRVCLQRLMRSYPSCGSNTCRGPTRPCVLRSWSGRVEAAMADARVLFSWRSPGGCTPRDSSRVTALACGGRGAKVVSL